MASLSAKAGGYVLVIDDDAILRDLVTDWLQAAGYRVRKATDCQSALEALDGGAPALIVSDMFMPGRCGGAAIAELKRYAPDAPLIAVSGYGQAEDQRRSREAGFDYHLVKPADFAKVQQILASASEKATWHPGVTANSDGVNGSGTVTAGG